MLDALEAEERQRKRERSGGGLVMAAIGLLVIGTAVVFYVLHQRALEKKDGEGSSQSATVDSKTATPAVTGSVRGHRIAVPTAAPAKDAPAAAPTAPSAAPEKPVEKPVAKPAVGDGASPPKRLLRPRQKSPQRRRHRPLAATSQSPPPAAKPGRRGKRPTSPKRAVVPAWRFRRRPGRSGIASPARSRGALR